MPMRPKTKLINVLIMNIPLAICMSAVASYLGMRGQNIPAEAFTGAYLQSVAVNSLMSYVICFFVGMFVPAPKWGLAFAGLFGVTPKDGIKFGLLMSLVINTVYTMANSTILTFVNVVVLHGAPIQAFLPAWLESFIPCWLVAFVIAFLWVPRAEGLARRITNDPAPKVPRT